MRADVHDLKDRRNHEGQEHVVAEIVADGPGVGQHLMSAQPHHNGRDQAEHGGGCGGERAGHGQRFHHIGQQALNPG